MISTISQNKSVSQTGHTVPVDNHNYSKCTGSLVVDRYTLELIQPVKPGFLSLPNQSNQFALSPNHSNQFSSPPTSQTSLLSPSPTSLTSFPLSTQPVIPLPLTFLCYLYFFRTIGSQFNVLDAEIPEASRSDHVPFPGRAFVIRRITAITEGL